VRPLFNAPREDDSWFRAELDLQLMQFNNSAFNKNRNKPKKQQQT